ncbi:MAG: hypothetical protein KBC21_02750 [Candidatus Pacebacteria bacterium]|nr:hypothetical protein [Candidatus Paceibacterota bacterium]
MGKLSFFSCLILRDTIKIKAASLVTIVAIVVGVSIVHVELVHAAALSSLADTQSSLKVNTLSDHTFQFVTPTGISAAQTISITFPAPSGYATGTFAIANFDLATSTSATCSGFTDAAIQSGAASGLTWGVSQATATIYITSGTATIPANRCVQIEIGSNATSSGTGVSQITNPTSASSSAIILIVAGADSGSITQNIITDDTVVISATVAQSISFVISTTTIYFGTLGTGAAKFASSTSPLGDSTETIAHTLAVTTNAGSGYTVTLRGQTLTSQQNSSHRINAMGNTAASSTINTEQFGIRATVSGGSNATIDNTFIWTTSYGFSATATTSEVFATGSSATNITTYSLRYIANVAGTTEAGTYVASLVYVATANY